MIGKNELNIGHFGQINPLLVDPGEEQLQLTDGLLASLQGVGVGPMEGIGIRIHKLYEVVIC